VLKNIILFNTLLIIKAIYKDFIERTKLL
jgi:hypothetical protein